jgi:tRNA U55 pseudouridine synthase TruB
MTMAAKAASAEIAPVNGWLVIDKPLGLTSTQVVGRVRRILRPR